MDFDGTVDPRMIEALRDAKRIILKFTERDGNNEIEMNLPFDTMVHIGAVAIASERPRKITIFAFNSDDKRRVIEYYPENGNYDIKTDEWKDTRLARVMLDIPEPSDAGLWRYVRDLNLSIETNTISPIEWEFRGRYCDLITFLKDYYISDDEEVLYNIIETIERI